MKTGTFIFSFLFVVLTIQPMFIKWDKVTCVISTNTTKILPQTGCCKKNVAKKCSSKQDKPQQTESPCNTCNPFMPCNACGYMPEEIDEFLSPDMLVNTDNTVRTDDLILSTYDDDWWHPPELFSIL